MSTTTSTVTTPLGAYPQLRLCGQVGITPSNMSIKTTNNNALIDISILHSSVLNNHRRFRSVNCCEKTIFWWSIDRSDPTRNGCFLNPKFLLCCLCFTPFRATLPAQYVAFVKGYYLQRHQQCLQIRRHTNFALSNIVRAIAHNMSRQTQTNVSLQRRANVPPREMRMLHVA